MSPKMGRPIMGDEPKDKQISLKVTGTTKWKFEQCAKISGETKTYLLEKLIELLYDQLTNKQ